MAQYLEKSDQQAARAYSPAVITEGGRTVWLAGQTATRDEAGNDISGNFDAQAKTIFGLIDKTLRRAGGTLANLVTMTVFINDPRNGDRFVELRKGFFPDGNFPASALITVSHFARSGMVIEIQGVPPSSGGEGARPSSGALVTTMLDYLRDNGSQILDGLLFGLGVLAVYLGAVFTGALIRSLGGAGSKGLTAAGRYLQGWFDYLRGDDRDIINVTLNIIVDNHLKFDTLVADRRIWFVWPNAYRSALIRGAARRTTEDNPVIAFAQLRRPELLGRTIPPRCGDIVHDMLASVKVVKDGKARRVRLQREDDYKATYGPLISLVSEKCSNNNSIDLALGPSDGRVPVRDRADLREAQQSPRAPPARHGDVGGEPAQPSRGIPALRAQGTRDAIPHVAGDRAAYRAHPGAFRGRQHLAPQGPVFDRAGRRRRRPSGCGSRRRRAEHWTYRRELGAWAIRMGAER